MFQVLTVMKQKHYFIILMNTQADMLTLDLYEQTLIIQENQCLILYNQSEWDPQIFL